MTIKFTAFGRLHPQNNLADLDDKSTALTNLGATSPATTVTIALAAGAANTLTATITVKDADGATVAGVHCLELWISEAATGIGLTADSYSGDVTFTTGTELNEFVSKKHYKILTAATGIAVLSAVDSGKPADQYIVVRAPLGAGLVVSAASGTNWGA